ncbi:MAG: hypothetical protein C5B49_02725 [Bdellovibrio sp.]|nr:MAG: hypothetical protein C5B49_02725 [Bdellovibrio sp.]
MASPRDREAIPRRPGSIQRASKGLTAKNEKPLLVEREKPSPSAIPQTFTILDHKLLAKAEKESGGRGLPFPLTFAWLKLPPAKTKVRKTLKVLRKVAYAGEELTHFSHRVVVHSVFPFTLLNISNLPLN